MITWKRIGLNNLTFPKVEEYSRKYINNGNLPLGVSIEQTISNIDRVLADTIVNEANGLGREFIDYVIENHNVGVTLKIPRKTRIEDPIKIDYFIDKKNPMVVDYNIIFAEEDSEITLIFDYNSDLDVEGFHNGLTKVYAKDNSKITIIKIQRFNEKSINFDSNIAFADGQAQVNWISVELGSSVNGSNYTTILNGTASEGNLSSIYLGDGTRKMDLGYSMIHKGPRSISNIDTKGVLMDEAKKVFRGNLDFKRGARRSKGSEEEYVILLDPKVKSDSIPGLFCEEDDVEGNHAASAGQIDESKLFYLMSRGLSEREAKKLIIESSFRPIIDKIPLSSIRDEIKDEIERRFEND